VFDTYWRGGSDPAAVQELRRVARKVVLLVEGHGNQEAAGHLANALIMWTHSEPAAVTDESR
jgi:hypothetical protein